LIDRVQIGYNIELEVLKTNFRAINLYKRIGFIEEANINDKIIRMKFKGGLE
jgi:ribosomal protein S18 acetylase RimI-like enzyme